MKKIEVKQNKVSEFWHRGKIGIASSIIAAVVMLGILPMPLAQAGPHISSVLRVVDSGAARIVKLATMQTTVSEHLKPYDPYILVVDSPKLWYCGKEGLDGYRLEYEFNLALWSNSIKSKKINKNELKGYFDAFGEMAGDYLEHQGADPITYWSKERSSGGFMPIVYSAFMPVSLNPAQGESVTKKLEHCYSKIELAVYQREAIRWATYMKKVWIPKQKKKYRFK